MNNRRLIDEDIAHFEVNEKLPHRDEMLLINGTAYNDKEKLVLSITMPSDSIFVAPNKIVVPLAMIEMLAQLCGAQYVFEQRSNGNRNLFGYLVSIDNVKFADSVYSGDKLDLVIRKTLALKRIRRIKGEIIRGDVNVVQAELTLYKTDQWMNQPEATDNQKEFVSVLSEENIPRAAELDAVGKGIVQSVINLEVKHEELIEALLYFKSNFVGFSGHFPGYPMLPGIVIIYAGWLLAELCVNNKLELCFIRKARFFKPIFPFDKVDVILKRLKKDNEQRIWYSVIIKGKGGLFSKYEIGTNLI